MTNTAVNVYLDIETGPLPEEQLLKLMKPFDPESVKVGNIKDPAKIAAKLADAESKQKESFIRAAALHPMRGEVLLIGLLVCKGHEGGAYESIGNDDGEAFMLTSFWNKIRQLQAGGTQESIQIVGWNIFEFDLPFLYTRSWKHDVRPPLGLATQKPGSDRVYWNGCIDLIFRWRYGVHRESRGSLGQVSEFLGIGSKGGSGADFHKLWATDRSAAIAYAHNDLDLTRKLDLRLTL